MFSPSKAHAAMVNSMRQYTDKVCLVNISNVDRFSLRISRIFKNNYQFVARIQIQNQIIDVDQHLLFIITIVHNIQCIVGGGASE